jgi:hypothetical protein
MQRIAPRSVFVRRQTTRVDGLDALSELTSKPVKSTLEEGTHELDELPTLDDFHHSPYRLNSHDDIIHQVRPFDYQRLRRGLLGIDTFADTGPLCE